MRVRELLFWTILILGCTAFLRAQDPGRAQDAEAEREKLAKAADQLDMIQSGYEATHASVDNLKTQVATLTQAQAKLEQENADLKTQLTALQASLQKSEQDRATEEKALLAQVAEMIANPKKTPHLKKPVVTDSEPTPKPTDATAVAYRTPETPVAPPTSAPSPDAVPVPTEPPVAITPTPEPVQRGYNHVVADGETLSIIARAYREQGVQVTVSEICRANHITSQTPLKVGQKLFIPRS